LLDEVALGVPREDIFFVTIGLLGRLRMIAGLLDESPSWALLPVRVEEGLLRGGEAHEHLRPGLCVPGLLLAHLLVPELVSLELRAGNPLLALSLLLLREFLARRYMGLTRLRQWTRRRVLHNAWSFTR